jgi:CubicO group peptidase (beta-lactamase class C family)
MADNPIGTRVSVLSPSRWVPDFGASVTIRELLHHTSGLRDQWLGWARAVLLRGFGANSNAQKRETLAFLDSLGERLYSPPNLLRRD